MPQIEEQWSMDLATLMDINKWLVECGECNRNTDIIGLRLSLKCLRHVVVPHLNPKEKSQEVEAWGNVLRSEIGYTIDNDMYFQDDIQNVLSEYELLLRQFLMDHNILMKKAQSFMQSIRS